MLCTTSVTKSQKASTFQAFTMRCSCSFGHEQGIQYSEHTQIHPNKHSKHHHQVHSKL